MNILTDIQRDKLLKVLASAPDDILTEAVVEMKRQRLAIQDRYRECAAYVGKDAEVPKEVPTPVQANISKALEEIAPGAKPYPKPETAPGIACSRVGSDTKDAIKAVCMKPSTLAEVNKFLKRGDGKLEDTKSVLKLLCDRKELVYAGGAYRNAS